MRLVSYSATSLFKRVTPLCLALFFCWEMWREFNTGGWNILLQTLPILVLVLGFIYLLLHVFVLRMVDEVWDDGGALVVKNRRREQRIPFSEIQGMEFVQFSRAQRATITLHQSGPFGKVITFITQGGFGRYAPNPVIEELIGRVHAASTAS